MKIHCSLFPMLPPRPWAFLHMIISFHIWFLYNYYFFAPSFDVGLIIFTSTVYAWVDLIHWFIHLILLFSVMIFTHSLFSHLIFTHDSFIFCIYIFLHIIHIFTISSLYLTWFINSFTSFIYFHFWFLRDSFIYFFTSNVYIWFDSLIHSTLNKVVIKLQLYLKL